MRVTARTYYKDYAQTVENLHSKLNTAMEQVSSGRKYSSAAESPTAYYAGQRMDNQYKDAETKQTVIKDVQNRLYQQESGARNIQQYNMRSVYTQVLSMNTDSLNYTDDTVATYKTQFEQELGSVVDTLNSQYDSFYVYGGNDMSTPPFTLDINLEEDNYQNVNDSSIALTYHHTFPGEDEVTHIKIDYSFDEDAGAYKNTYSLVDSDGNAIPGTTEDDALDRLVSAMREQGKMSTGYGSLNDRTTLIDTYTGGLNMLTGISSDTLQNLSDEDAKARIRGGYQTDAAGNKTATGVETEVKPAEDSMLNTPVSIISKAILTANRLIVSNKTGTEDDQTEAREQFHTDLAAFIDQYDNSESRISNTYREMGVKSSALTRVSENLDLTMDTITENYKDKLGIDMYDAITTMYSYQTSYNAAMQVGSKIMQSSLFDYVS